MSAVSLGRVAWSMETNEEGHRTYKLRSKVRTTDPEDGPASVFFAAGLPTFGSTWAEGNDVDNWAFCLPNVSITPINNNDEPETLWYVDQTFSTKPLTLCRTSQIEDPLAEPANIGGSFIKFTKQHGLTFDDKVIKNTAHEPFTGPLVERDENRPSVHIEINTLHLDLDVFTPLVDTINDAPLWGLPARYVKLCNVTWERKLYGTCSFYFTKKFEFEINPKSWDRKIPNIGDKCLIGWGAQNKPEERLDPFGIDPDTGDENRLNPKNYEQYKDVRGENAKVFLDTEGRPIDGDPIFIDYEPYDEANLLLLGIPTTLD